MSAQSQSHSQQPSRNASASTSTRKTRTPVGPGGGRGACLACRHAKVKCVPLSEESGPLDVCARCTRLGLSGQCTYGQQKRGRKVAHKRSGSELSPESESRRPSPYTPATIPKPPTQHSQPAHHPHQSSSSGSSSTNLSSTSASHVVPFHNPHDNRASSSAPSFVQSHSNYTYLYPQKDSHSPDSGQSDASGSSDRQQPITPIEPLYPQGQTFEHNYHPSQQLQHLPYPSTNPYPHNQPSHDPNFPQAYVPPASQQYNNHAQQNQQVAPYHQQQQQQQPIYRSSYQPQHQQQIPYPPPHQLQNQPSDFPYSRVSSDPNSMQRPTSSYSIPFANPPRYTQQPVSPPPPLLMKQHSTNDLYTNNGNSEAFPTSSHYSAPTYLPPSHQTDSQSRPYAQPVPSVNPLPSSSAPPASLGLQIDSPATTTETETPYSRLASFIQGGESYPHLHTQTLSAKTDATVGHQSTSPISHRRPPTRPRPDPTSFYSIRNLLNDVSTSSPDTAKIRLPPLSALANLTSSTSSRGVKEGVLSVADVFQQADKDLSTAPIGQGACGSGPPSDPVVEGSGGVRVEGGKRMQEAKRRVAGGANVRKTSQGWEDPFGAGLLDEQQVYALFEFHHTQLNIFSDILDPSLHTPSYTRKRCPILFACVLTVAARVILPAIYPALLKFANQMIGRAFVEGLVEVGLIQSLEILSFWKATSDTGAWRRSGYAIRMAYELDLHMDSQTTLPADDTAAREILDRERCWYQLISSDILQSILQGKPRMIIEAHEKDVLAWSTDHPLQPCHVDRSLAALSTFLRLSDFSVQILSAKDTAAQEMLTLKQEEAFRDWKRDWLESEEGPKGIHVNRRIALKFCACIFRFKFDQLQVTVLRLARPEDPFSKTDSAAADLSYSQAFNATIESALEVVRTFEELGPFLNLVHESIMFGTPAATLFLAKNIHRVSKEVSEVIVSALKTAQATCLAFIRDPGDYATFLAKLFESILFASSSQQSSNSGPTDVNRPVVPSAQLAEPPSANGSSLGPASSFQNDPGFASNAPSEAAPAWPFDGAVVDENISLEDLFADFQRSADYPFDLFQLS